MATAKLRQLLVTLFLFFSSVIYSVEKVDLKYLNADVNSYVGKIVNVKGAVSKPIFSPESDRVDIPFADVSNVTVIIEKESPLYKDVIDFDLEYGNTITVTGKIHKYRNSASVYILATEITKGTTLMVWFMRVCIVIIISSAVFLILGIFGKSANQNNLLGEQVTETNASAKKE